MNTTKAAWRSLIDPMRTLARARPNLQSNPTTLRPRWRTPAQRRLQSTKPPQSPNPSSSSDPATANARFDRLHRRTPKFLQRYLSALRSAPLSHITAFLILHELTAIVPLIGLAGLFHYTSYLPPWFAEGRWVVEGTARVGAYFRKKGWVEERETRHAQEVVAERDTALMEEQGKNKKGAFSKWWNRGEDGTRWIVEFATAYAVVKVLLPLRLGVSVALAPRFARWTTVPVGRAVWGRVGRVFGKGKEKAVVGAEKGVREVAKEASKKA